jgi:hypothetical protein
LLPFEELFQQVRLKGLFYLDLGHLVNFRSPLWEWALKSGSTAFPPSISRLKNLTYLSRGRNRMPEIPLFVADLPRLRMLDFSWNMEVKEILVFLTNLRELTILRLDADGLTDPTDFLSKLPELREISLGDNCSITQNPAKRQNLQHRFPGVTVPFRKRV